MPRARAPAHLLRCAQLAADAWSEVLSELPDAVRGGGAIADSFELHVAVCVRAQALTGSERALRGQQGNKARASVVRSQGLQDRGQTGLAGICHKLRKTNLPWRSRPCLGLLQQATGAPPVRNARGVWSRLLQP